LPVWCRRPDIACVWRWSQALDSDRSTSCVASHRLTLAVRDLVYIGVWLLHAISNLMPLSFRVSLLGCWSSSTYHDASRPAVDSMLDTCRPASLANFTARAQHARHRLRGIRIATLIEKATARLAEHSRPGLAEKPLNVGKRDGIKPKERT
jgi:hypothetical protein